MYAVFRRARASPGSPKIRAWLATWPHCTATSSSSIPAPRRTRLAAPCRAGTAATARTPAAPEAAGERHEADPVRADPVDAPARHRRDQHGARPDQGEDADRLGGQAVGGPVSSSAIDVHAALNVPNISAWYTHDRRRSGSARISRTGAASSAP